MFKIYNDRAAFYQWDLNQKLIVEDKEVSEVHFTDIATDKSYICRVYEEDGLRVVNVPNILLQTSFDIKAYSYCNDYTKKENTFRVIAKSKPDDYIYTETEKVTVEQLIAEGFEVAKANGDFKGDKGDRGEAGAIKMIPIADFPTENIDESAIYAKAIANWVGSSGAWINGAITITTAGFKEAIANVKYFRIVVRNSANTNIKPEDLPKGVLTFVKHDGSIECPVMVQGTIDGEKIIDTVTTRIYTKDLFFTSQYKEIKLASGYSMWAHFYNGDNFNEYIYIDGAWELIGGAGVEINLEDYVKKTDYATDKTFGVIKVANGNYGIGHNEAAGLYIAQASEYYINGKTDNYKPITPKVLDYAVKVGLTTNTIELTEEEKANACNWLGTIQMQNNPNTAYKQVYVINENNEQVLVRMATAQGAEKIPMTDGYGCLKVSSPKKTNDAANKEYVDNAIAALREELLGGTAE